MWFMWFSCIGAGGIRPAYYAFISSIHFSFGHDSRVLLWTANNFQEMKPQVLNLLGCVFTFELNFLFLDKVQFVFLLIFELNGLYLFSKESKRERKSSHCSIAESRVQKYIIKLKFKHWKCFRPLVGWLFQLLLQTLRLMVCLLSQQLPTMVDAFEAQLWK